MGNRRAFGKAVLLILCWLLAFASMNISLAEETQFSFTMHVFVPIVLIFGFLFLWRISKVFFNWQLWIVSFIFAGVITLGVSFSYEGSSILVTTQILKSLFYFLGHTTAFYMGMTLLLEVMKSTKTTSHRYPFWIYGLILLICWLPYLLAVWPGTVSNDSVTQLEQIYGVQTLTNANPLFQTGLIWLAATIGQGIFQSADMAIALYVVIQGLLMALLLGYTVQRIADSNAPAWLVWLALGVYALCPIFPLYAFCVGKDTNFAMAVLWLMLSVWRMMETEKPFKRDTLSLCLSAVLCVLLRNAGIGIAAVTLTVLLIFMLIKHMKCWRKVVMAMGSVVASLFVLYAVAIPVLLVEPSPESETLSVPLQQVARVVANAELPEEYYDAVDAVLPIDELQGVYNGEISDPVKLVWQEDATTEEKIAFFSAWFKLGLEKPATYLSAFFHNSYGYIMPGFVSTIKPAFLLGDQGKTDALEDYFDYSVNPNAVAMDEVLDKLLTYAPFRILTAPGLYGWIAIFAFAVIISSKRRRMLLIILPALLVLVGCFFSPVNGYFRYAMPVYCSAPLLLAVAALAIGKKAPIAV